MIDEPAENGAVLRLKGLRNSLSPAEQRVADFIIGNAADVPYSTVHEIAEQSGASEATVVRLCRSAGFAGFNDLKIKIVHSVGESISHIQRDLAPGDTSATILEKVFRANVTALMNSLKTIDEGAFERTVELLSGASTITFMGVGTSGTVAMDAVQKFLPIGIHVTSYTDIVLQALSAASMGPKDVVVGLSQSGATQAVVSALESAASRGAAVIAVTSEGRSPITQIASETLLLSSTELSFQSTTNQLRTAQLSVIDALCISVAMRMPDTYLQKSQALEDASRRLHIP